MSTVQEITKIDTGALKKFAQTARRQLREQVTANLDRVLKADSIETREKQAAIKELKREIERTSRDAVIDRVAYTWFNRFCALRFMDANHYTTIGVVSPAIGFTQPEILAEAKQGHIDDTLKPLLKEQTVFQLLDGQIPSSNPQQEAFRLLIVAVCNYYNSIMPFLFEQIADYTELLMPDDLLSESSVLTQTRDTLTQEVCKNVEVIGWLYQFYISEKKDQVFEDLKKNKKITPENIPAATQLFTPRWIVRYLLENSLGRLWMLNKPTSRLVKGLSYYIKPAQGEIDFLRITKPEELKVCDPACGSGHMLVYAFDVLYAIYEEEGYEPTEIPHLILKNNLYGIEIDDRAGALAAFALLMKAREKSPRFFRRPTQPNICVLENIQFDEGELVPYFTACGENLFADNLRKALHQFPECDNFGSLIRPVATGASALREMLERKNIADNIFLHKTHERVLQVLRYGEYLSPKYQVVIANPPYMGASGMNPRLSAWAKDSYPDSKSDLFSMFIERAISLAVDNAFVAMVTMQSWMFLSSYEALRKKILRQTQISTLAQIGYNSFPELNSKVVQACAFVLTNNPSRRPGIYLNLNDAPQSADKESVCAELIRRNDLIRVNQSNFDKIPGNPIAYWIPDFGIFDSKKVGDEWVSGGRIKTHDGQKFIRYWWEPSRENTRWKRLVKGGDYRKHFGNEDFLVDWSDSAVHFYESHGGLYAEKFRVKEGICWSKVTSGSQSFRIKRDITEYDSASPTLFSSNYKCDPMMLAFLNSSVSQFLLNAINPTLNTQVADVMALPLRPLLPGQESAIRDAETKLIDLSMSDWNSFETSWDFSCSPLLESKLTDAVLSEVYSTVRAKWLKSTLEMQHLEQRNNNIFIEAYGLEARLPQTVPLEHITISCNPAYRYDANMEADLENFLLTDTIKELISYSVGCMLGRYSIDKNGLILGNQGQTKEDYLKQVPKPMFPVDDDNVLPILDGDWFTDDISDRFRRFLRVAFGDLHYEANLQFIENTLGKDIRKYFLKDFYTDHVRRYKKRPIYWLFSSPKGTFNALIYMHRYRPDTVSIVLNDYLREFRNKLAARKNHLEAVTVSANATSSEKNKALKEIELLKKSIDDLDTYERDILYPLATKKISIDLDDGVKVNYAKLGKSLKTIPGMANEED